MRFSCMLGHHYQYSPTSSAEMNNAMKILVYCTRCGDCRVLSPKLSAKGILEKMKDDGSQNKRTLGGASGAGGASSGLWGTAIPNSGHVTPSGGYIGISRTSTTSGLNTNTIFNSGSANSFTHSYEDGSIEARMLETT